jgi:hypothetical protein
MLMTPTQVNLVEMAALADISATSYTLSVGSQPPSFSCYAVDDNYNSLYMVERKSYCAIYINKYRTIACIDSGSDLTVMQYELFNSLFNRTSTRILQDCTLKSITSFSANPITVHGQFTCYIGFSPGGPTVPITITVIMDIVGVPNFLFGNDSLRATWAIFAFAGDKDDPQPELVVRNPQEQKVEIFYVPPRDIYTCESFVVLKPFETATVNFMLNKAAPVLRNNEIIISSIDWNDVQIFPSKIYGLTLLRTGMQPQVWWQI